MNAPGGKRKRITLDQKAAMIKAVESGTKKSKVARDFDVSTSTLSTILSKQQSIIDAVAHASDEPLLDEPATPDGFATSDEVAASWTALRDAGVVPDSESFCDYVSADSEVVATEQLLDDDIVRAVNDPDETSDDDSADELADSVPKASNVPTASEALDAVDVLRRYYGAHEGGEDGMNIAAAAERAIVRIRKMQQRPITDFFAATAV
ncbi:hypothetical protein HPB52_020700 [Rhipicephalus sanguineus]|uniref:HTH psq-type domain-containing protein n=1 Tax=Rhipicephalus sanguineus TaxID=34632 RepID=A0A9D4YQV8_RHISA|nr:hypothetical protein HPB52_020700 [Rhipicephalus sanguineus]